jgi:hypothetical protein
MYKDIEIFYIEKNLFYSQNWLNLHELNFGYIKKLEQKTLHPISLSIMLCLYVLGFSWAVL